MMRSSDYAGAVYAMTLAAAVGLGLTWWTSGDRFRLGAVEDGPWIAWPMADPQNADRYSRARIARSGDLPLGPGEGLVFTAREDSASMPLEGRCHYRVGPILPPARWWTLTLYDSQGRPEANPSARYGFASSAVLRGAQGSVAVEVAPEIRPGNWLPSAPGPFQLVLRLYDSPVSTGLGTRNAIAMPEIQRSGCGA
jgi:hypothetical protein